MEQYRVIEHIELTDICKCNDVDTYAFDIQLQDLIMLDLNQGVVKRVKHFGFDPGKLVFRLFEFKEELIMFDKISLSIVVYNILDDTTETIGDGRKSNFTDFVRYKDTIYLFPLHLREKYYKFDLRTKALTEIDWKLELEIRNASDCVAYLNVSTEFVYMPVIEEHYILVLSMESEKVIDVINVPANINLCSCASFQDSIYVTSVDSTSIHLIKNGKANEIYSGVSAYKPYSYLKIYGDLLITLPGQGGLITVYDLAYKKINTTYTIAENGYEGSKSIGAYFDGNSRVSVLPYRMHELIQIDYMTSSIKTVDVKYDIVDCVRQKITACEGLLGENSESELMDYLVYVNYM